MPPRPARAPIGIPPAGRVVLPDPEKPHSSLAAHRAGYAKPKTGLDLTRGIINDMARQTRLNEVSTRFADAHPDVHTIDLRGTVCLTGTPTPTLDGVPLCADGVHWTHEGIAAVWGGLAGQVSAVHDAG